MRKLSRFRIWYSTLGLKLCWKLIKWWSNNYMDQWERWELKTKEGPLYVTISRKSDGHDYDQEK